MCEKCQDRGSFELDKAGIYNQLCDCEAGNRKRVELGIPEEETDALQGNYISQEEAKSGESVVIESIEIPKIIDEVIDDSNSGTESDNRDTGSPDTSKPKQPKKPKAKKRAGKRTG